MESYKFHLVFYLAVVLLFGGTEQVCLANEAVPKAPTLSLDQTSVPVGEKFDLVLDFIAGQRGFMSSISILVPLPITVDMERTTVNVIGRGEVSLATFPEQSIGRTASEYSYTKVGRIDVDKVAGGTLLTFHNIDLRPFNGIDLRLRFKEVSFIKKDSCTFEANYTASSRYNLPPHLQGRGYVAGNDKVSHKAVATLYGVENQRVSTPIVEYENEWNIKQFGACGDDMTDDTDAVNAAIRKLNERGGGTLYFPEGNYMLRTVHLLSNVWLHIGEKAVLKALPGADSPEETWFVNYSYNAGNGSLDSVPYQEPDNYLVKQDVGHSFFHNCMFFGERIENVKIWGNGRITGNGNIESSNEVMNNSPELRSDKMFVFKLCKNIEVGGISNEKDMWYDEATDEPCYLEPDGTKNSDVSNMLHIDQGGHFVVLATGTDNLNVHDIYCGKHSSKRARDILDFMGCCDVTVTNIYSRVNGDDIVKIGSDCALGFTRPSRNFLIRNIVGDTNCNVFQIGSETADDIEDVYVDNIYVLATNKAGFSISANDGGCIRNIYLNSGKTGRIHSRSVMHRTRTPFFISISNRGRVLGASVAPYRFKENDVMLHELLVTNSNISKVENVVIRDVDVDEVYAGSCYYNSIRWKAYDGSQPESTPIIAGFKLPASDNVAGGLNFSLPDGRSVSRIKHVEFHRVNIKVKGGHPEEDARLTPPEIGVGKFNIRDLKVQPAWGFWVRHAEDLLINDCSISTEKTDGRYPVLLDDVCGAKIINLKIKAGDTLQKECVKAIQSNDVEIIYY